ncbi:MAG TPA: response regulator [Verrucomicrobiae bacterium]|nr:response regulator [Verrucomicrobiae bacterium]
MRQKALGALALMLCGAAMSAHAAETAETKGLISIITEKIKNFPSTVLVEAALILSGIWVIWKMIPLVKNFLATQLQLSIFLRPSPDAWPKGAAEEEEFSKFVIGFQAGPERTTGNAANGATKEATPVAAIPAETRAETPATGALVKVGEVEEFFADAPACFLSMRTLCEKMNRAPNKASQRDVLFDLTVKVQHIKTRAGVLELRTIWQVASTLEGLLKQLTDRVNNITASTLHTVTGGVELLRDICVPQVKDNFITSPPIRILAVDDDAVSRFAITSAIRKAFDEPELAESGNVALKLAGMRAFDMIFLDVRMPGMDGFELCSKIRETELNRNTPVVFVTSMNDFESWAQSAISGGNDLIAKPFLSFEITVKVLTFVLRGRLKAMGIGVEPAAPPVDAVVWPAPPLPDSSNFIEKMVKKGSAPKPIAPAEPNGKKTLATVLSMASAYIQEIQKQLPLLTQTTDEETIRETLVSIYFQSLSLAQTIDVPELRSAFELCSVMEGLLKKLRQNPKNLKESTYNTIVMGMDLLKELCAEGIPNDLASKTPVRILVVDDDPIGRRAILGALQTAFFRPDGAEGGKAALAMLADKTFDVVFLDVQMPDMDGFAVCRKIRENAVNRTTPVVFVTSNYGAKWREEATQAGGSDYVVKPFPFIEITVKALTFVLRGRLQKFKEAQAAKTPAAAA